MANSKAAELRELTDDELVTRLESSRRRSSSTCASSTPPGQLDNTARIDAGPPRVARIDTLLREREIEAAERDARRETSDGERAVSDEQTTTERGAPQGPRGRRRVRQDGQDRRRRRHRPRAAPAATARSCSARRSSTPTTRPTTPTWATGSASMETRPLSKTKRWRVVEIVELRERARPMIQQETRLRWPTTPAPRRSCASRCSAAPPPLRLDRRHLRRPPSRTPSRARP